MKKNLLVFFSLMLLALFGYAQQKALSDLFPKKDALLKSASLEVTSQVIQKSAETSNCTIDALILFSDDEATTLQTNLMATGKFNSVGLFNLNLNPNVTLADIQNYDAVLVYFNYPANYSIIKQALQGYMDLGGGVVTCVATNFGSWNLQLDPGYAVVGTAPGYTFSALSFGTIHDSSHPIMEGISSITLSNNAYYYGAPLNPEATIIADWNNGEPAIAVRENISTGSARAADLNFFPHPYHVEDPNAYLLMANTLLWTSQKCDCPDIVADNDPGTCGAVVTYDAPAPGGAIVTQVDNSGLTSGDLFPIGETVQEYELDFGPEGKDTCSFTVTVNDAELPVPTCPANVTTGNDPGEDGALVWYASTQNFTGPFAPENWDLVTNGGNGHIDLSGAPTQITLWGSDGSGASSPDTEYKITIPSDGMMSFDWDYYTYDWGPNYDPFGYSINGVFTQLTDNSGSGTQNGSISIPLNQGDVFAFVVQTTDDAVGPGTSTMVSFSFDSNNIDVSDNCPGATIEADHENGSFFPFGETVVTLTATDASGNMATCSFTVTVVDIDPPVAVANPIEVVLDETGKYTLTPEDLEEMAQGSTDNYTASGDLKLSAYPKMFVCDNVGETMHVRLTVEDENGNTDWQWTTVTVIDTLPPVALCQDIEVYLDENGEASITPEDVAVSGEDGSYDACGIVSLELDKETFGCADAGPNNVTITVTDPSGNTGTCTAVVTVKDTFPPVFEPVADIQLEVEAGVTETAINYPGIVVTDNCTLEPQLTEGLGPDGLFPLGTTTETWAASDPAGNMATVSFTVTVTAINSPPVLVNPIADQVVNASYVLKVPVRPELGEVFDDVDGDELTISAMLENGDPLPAWVEMVDDSLVFTPLIADTGCVSIIVKATDPDGAAAADTFQLCVDGYPVSSPAVDAAALNVTLYPNPTRDRVTIEVQNSISGPAEVSVFTMDGKLVLQRNYTDNRRISFSMREHVSGMYFVKINLQGKDIVKKLVLNK
ncbi:HYR domain-containing protein [Mariniphaga sediminis]|uniref:HYR domain-containing protein n=1 Tax=Mariniphaga sediminis TaxID=1628158 RepID=A0A399D6P6_9BACT|nr:HYR domain-containing protein [Mariniphaga sediminis]RIH66070.1 HYR domain-containing protein [Mariniphaga sediminis]